MCKKLSYVLSLMLLLSLASHAQAQVKIYWDNDSGDGRLSTPSNWAGDALPPVNDIAVISNGAGNGPTTIDLPTGMYPNGIYRFLVGDESGSGEMTMDSPSDYIETSNLFMAGSGAGSEGLLTMSAGEIHSREFFFMGGTGTETDAVGTFNFSGGTVRAKRFMLGEGNSGVGVMNMSGGVVTSVESNLSFGQEFIVGRGNVGTLNMTGGTIGVDPVYGDPITAGSFGIATNGIVSGGVDGAAPAPDAVGEVHLDGGTIYTTYLRMADTIGAQASMDISGGTFVIRDLDPAHPPVLPTDYESMIGGNAVNPTPLITAYDGTGSLMIDVGVLNAHSTTLYAITHNYNEQPRNYTSVDPIDPLADPQVFPVSALSWNLPSGVGTITCDVRFGTDPNIVDGLLDPSTSTEILTNSTDETVALPAPLVADTSYYWQVIIHDSAGPDRNTSVFTFNTFNQAPFVIAGKDISIYLDETGTAVYQLEGAYYDLDGPAENPTISWTPVGSAPAPDDPTAIAPTVTFTTAGAFIYRLDANDGAADAVQSTVKITVFEDSCAHAVGTIRYPVLEWVWTAGDANRDCVVDLYDVADLAAGWLSDQRSD